MLIDFDWCGKHDMDKYPPSMNKNLSWPPGAEPCALLKKEHDIHWLNLLRDKFKSYMPPKGYRFLHNILYFDILVKNK
ncbi:10596_t:CDS:2 [Dentiscutata erythropus]|uniref:10596_t:CDS:1 n=1 Tax=Dentiscutata erythropus TaxID=1348616 RepID=A0A9N9EN21_9GLOM|nr:10596_t:CDS:2 [Dentiscutata erythropus]